MQRGEEHPHRDPDRLLHVVALVPAPRAVGPRFVLPVDGEDHDEQGRGLEEGLAPVGAERGEVGQPRGRRAPLVELALLAFSAASRMRRFTSGSRTTTNRQGWRFAPEGALAAASIAASTRSRGTGSGEKSRTLRRRRSRSRRAVTRRAGLLEGEPVEGEGHEGFAHVRPAIVEDRMVADFHLHTSASDGELDAVRARGRAPRRTASAPSPSPTTTRWPPTAGGRARCSTRPVASGSS